MAEPLLAGARPDASASARCARPTASTSTCAEGETHAVIGPNGAGKTTFISQLAGDLRPDAGASSSAARTSPRCRAAARAQGLARSFQITSVYPEFTALDNVALAVQAHAGHSFRFWRDARARCGAARAGARRARRRSASAHAPTSSRPTCRTASSGSSRWRWRSPRSRGCCCSTSRWPAWAPRNRSA